MSLWQMCKVYVLMVPVFFILDMIWLGLVAKGFYRTRLADLLSQEINWAAAVIFYLLFLLGLLVFVVLPAAEKGSLASSLVRGLFFGLVTYATYDLTNLATLKGWPVSVAVVDILWGMALSAMVGMAGFGFARWMG
jgi:uncharacterized membrane protein